MEVHTFKGQGRVFGFTQERSGASLPSEYGPWMPFKVLELVRGQPQLGVDVDECLDDILAYGFHLTDAHVRITPQAIPGTA